MPQGPAHLHRRFLDDGIAMRYLLRRGFGHHRGVIVKPHVRYVVSHAEIDAVTYLIQEWDYHYRSDVGLAPLPVRLTWRRRLSRATATPLRVIDKARARIEMWWYDYRG